MLQERKHGVCRLSLNPSAIIHYPGDLEQAFSKEYSGLISFSIDWFDLLADQETLKSLL